MRKKKDKQKINLLGYIRKHLDLILDMLYYVSFIGIICSIIVMAWGDLRVGIKLLVTFILMMGLVIYAAFKTDGYEEDKDTSK